MLVVGRMIRVLTCSAAFVVFAVACGGGGNPGRTSAGEEDVAVAGSDLPTAPPAVDEGESSSGETSGDDTVDELVDLYGPAVAFEAVALALERGYGIDEVDRAAREGRLQESGLIVDLDGVTVEPSRPRAGVLVIPDDRGDGGEETSMPAVPPGVRLVVAAGDDSGSLAEPLTLLDRIIGMALHCDADPDARAPEEVTRMSRTEFHALRLLITLARSGYSIEQIVELVLYGTAGPVGFLCDESAYPDCMFLTERSQEGSLVLIPPTGTAATDRCEETIATAVIQFNTDAEGLDDGDASQPTASEDRRFTGTATISYSWSEPNSQGCTIDLSVETEFTMEANGSASIFFGNWPIHGSEAGGVIVCKELDEPRYFAGSWSAAGDVYEALLPFAETGQAMPVEVRGNTASTTTVLEIVEEAIGNLASGSTERSFYIAFDLTEAE